MNKFILFFAITLLANSTTQSMERDETNDALKIVTELTSSIESQLKVEKHLLKQDKATIIQKWIENIKTHPKASYQHYKEMGSENQKLQADIQNLLKGNTTEKEILNAKNKSLEAKKLRPHHILLTAAASAWVSIEIYDAYKKLSAHEKWNDAGYAKRAALVIKHTAKNMASRPAQAFACVKEKLRLATV